MKYNEIKDLTTEELVARLAEAKSTYNNMQLTHALSPLENPLEIRAARKTIARLSTELSTRSQD
ncbi:MAG: hypothetical protein RL754_626 [Bacteroidota bacterium]|jgi:large subunit ribosomal protein L29